MFALTDNMLQKTKEWLNTRITLIASALAKAGFNQNSITILGFSLGVLASFFLASGSQMLAGLVIFVCGFFDMINGPLVRISRAQTKFGGVLDSFVNRYVDFMFIAGIFIGGLSEAGGLPGWMWCMLALSGSFMVSYTRARGEAAGSGNLDIGIAGRAERLLVLAITSLLGYARYGLALLVFMSHFTAFQRLLATKRRLG